MATENPEQPEHPYKTAVNAVGGFFGNIADHMAAAWGLKGANERLEDKASKQVEIDHQKSYGMSSSEWNEREAEQGRFGSQKRHDAKTGAWDETVKNAAASPSPAAAAPALAPALAPAAPALAPAAASPSPAAAAPALAPAAPALAPAAASPAAASPAAAAAPALAPAAPESPKQSEHWFKTATDTAGALLGSAALNLGAAFGLDSAQTVLSSRGEKETNEIIKRDENKSGILKPMTKITPHALEDPRNFPAMVKNGEMSQSEADRRTRNEWGAAGDTSHPKPEVGDMPSPPPIVGTTSTAPTSSSPAPAPVPPSLIDVSEASKPGNGVNLTSAATSILKDPPTLTASLITNTPTSSPPAPAPDPALPNNTPRASKPSAPSAPNNTPKPEKKEQPQLNYNNSSTEVGSSSRNQSNISEMEYKFKNLNDIRDVTKNNTPGGGSSNNSSSVTTNNNNNQQTTVVSADHLDRIRRSFQQLPSWRTDIG